MTEAFVPYPPPRENGDASSSTQPETETTSDESGIVGQVVSELRRTGLTWPA